MILSLPLLPCDVHSSMRMLCGFMWKLHDMSILDLTLGSHVWGVARSVAKVSNAVAISVQHFRGMVMMLVVSFSELGGNVCSVMVMSSSGLASMVRVVRLLMPCRGMILWNLVSVVLAKSLAEVICESCWKKIW